MKYQTPKRSAFRLTVTGSVQGIGYRPFVRREAISRSLGGYVKNSGGGVCIYACGEKEALDSFVRCLRTSPPSGTVYTTFEIDEAADLALADFRVETSDTQSLLPLVMPDLAPCEGCTRELFDPNNRRYRHAFISCASCGPRFSLQSALPYDRVRTSMADFPLCRDCQSEYDSTEGSRSYAQTLCCPNCGPQLTYSLGDRIFARKDSLDACVAHLQAGGIDAIKNVGGFYLACKGDDERAVQALRALKGREEKPFALLFTDLDSLREVAQVSEEEEALLTSPARPIVLLRRKQVSAQSIAPSVCGDSLYIGAMLPSSPLQHLLVRALGILVMTSANRSGEPLCYAREELGWLGESVGILDHDRPIILPQDDSIAFVAHCGGRARPLLLRRARGYAPTPIRLPKAVDTPTLAAGGDLKAVFALVEGAYAYLSPYLGDLEAIAAQARWSDTESHMRALFGITPTRVLCDLHPNYHSPKLAQKARDLGPNHENYTEKYIKIQHHHAHIASVMAEHSLTDERVLGFAFDGTGYGDDGSIWGGELLLCEGGGYERLAHLSALPMLGGDSGALDCRRTATTFLLASGRAAWDEPSRILHAALKAGIGAVATSSMGRLFDAAASILELSHANAYEGQAANALEASATLWQERGGTSASLTLAEEEGVWRSDRLLIDLLEQKENGVPIGALALGFHHAIAEAVEKAAVKYSRICGAGALALSGGCFANRLLLASCTERLSARGMRVYFNEQLPAGDGNIALGQAFIAAMRDHEYKKG